MIAAGVALVMVRRAVARAELAPLRAHVGPVRTRHSTCHVAAMDAGRKAMRSADMVSAIQPDFGMAFPSSKVVEESMRRVLALGQWCSWMDHGHTGPIRSWGGPWSMPDSSWVWTLT